MDQVYLDNVKSTNNNKKWVDIDKRGSLHTLECKEAVEKFVIFSGHECLDLHLKRMKRINSGISVFCNQNSIMNSEHLFQ